MSGSSGRPFIGHPGEKSRIHATSRVRAGETTVRCEICGELVATRAQQTLISSHRIGSTTKNSWPCPGSGSPVARDED